MNNPQYSSEASLVLFQVGRKKEWEEISERGEKEMET